MLEKVLEQIRNHNGKFLCEAIGSESDTKIVDFSHSITPPKDIASVPKIGGLRDFYSLVGSLTLYSCPDSDEAAFYIAPPEEWAELKEEFAGWVDVLDEDEEDLLPSWFGSHQIVGEIPASGNYLLVVTSGAEAGTIYEFEHDGFEFIKVGVDLQDFIAKALDPTPSSFSQIASHMRFISGASAQQWWARELQHASGKVVINND